MAGKKRRPASRGRTSPSRLAEQLGRVEALMAGGRWPDADEVLRDLERVHPSNPDVLALRLAVAAQLGDFAAHQRACEQLLTHYPDDGELLLIHAGSCLANGRPALALRGFGQFLRRWPDHPEAARVRQTVADMEPDFRRHLAEIGLGGDDDLKLAALHEQVQVHLERGQYQAARAKAAELLQARPTFAPALNNMSEAYCREGDYPAAVASAQRVLAVAPDNVHALANLTRFLVLAGRSDEAAEAAGRLRAARPTGPDGWVKVAEALGYLGDDEGVLAAAAGAKAHKPSPTGVSAALLYHLAGVAAYRQGREAEARKHWRQALKQQPGFDTARDNLEDLKRPVGERHAAWPFSLPGWLPESVLRRLADRVKGKKGEDRLRAEARRFLEERPDVAALVPLLLDRGDPQGRAWALTLAQLADTPALQTALRDFALSRRGPDDQRLEAARAASEAGLLPSGLTRMWVRGAWSELLLFSFELTDEPTRSHTAEVADLAAEAHAALLERDGVRAEAVLRRALDKAPDAPDLLNNLAAAYEMQDRQDEALDLQRSIFERFPDYSFGRITMARLAMRAGRVEEAAELLKPLLQTRVLHNSEFAALAAAEVELQLARGEPGGAEAWLEMWAEALPDHPDLPAWRERVGMEGVLDRLKGMIGRRKKK
jgi:tetratricopeptide (TPR) repeat protein